MEQNHIGGFRYVVWAIAKIQFNGEQYSRHRYFWKMSWGLKNDNTLFKKRSHLLIYQKLKNNNTLFKNWWLGAKKSNIDRGPRVELVKMTAQGERCDQWLLGTTSTQRICSCEIPILWETYRKTYGNITILIEKTRGNDGFVGFYGTYPLVNIQKLSMFLIGKLTISMAMFNSYVTNYQRAND